MTPWNSVLHVIFKDTGIIRAALAPFYLKKNRNRSTMIDFNFFWLCSFSLMDLLSQWKFLGQTFRGDNFSGRLRSCQTALSLAHFSRIMISVQIFFIACYRLSIMVRGLSMHKSKPKKSIDRKFCLQVFTPFPVSFFSTFVLDLFRHVHSCNRSLPSGKIWIKRHFRRTRELRSQIKSPSRSF